MKIKNIFLVVLLIALAISLGFNYLLYDQIQTLNSKYDNNFAMVLKIDVYHNGIWKNVLYKTGDLLKFNFGNLTALWTDARSSSQPLNAGYLTFYFLEQWQYSITNYTNGNGFFKIPFSCSIWQINAQLLAQNLWYFWGWIPPTQQIGNNIYTIPFRIGFGNSTAPFGTPFPSLGYSTSNINFGYKGTQCAMSSHEFVSPSSGYVVTYNTQSTTNRIFLNYTGYWTNSYSTSYSIVYTRLYVPLIEITSSANLVNVFWLLIAEDSFTAVTLNSGDIVRITYSLQINP